MVLRTLVLYPIGFIESQPGKITDASGFWVYAIASFITVTLGVMKRLAAALIQPDRSQQ
jgi:hypothetical protein